MAHKMGHLSYAQQQQHYLTHMSHYQLNGGTGGHYDLPGAHDDFTGSSYLSSASKRQRIDDAYRNLLPGPHMLVSHSVPAMNGNDLLPANAPPRTLPIGAPFITSVSEECASVENLENAEADDNAVSNSSSLSSETPDLAHIIALTRSLQRKEESKVDYNKS